MRCQEIEMFTPFVLAEAGFSGELLPLVGVKLVAWLPVNQQGAREFAPEMTRTSG